MVNWFYVVETLGVFAVFWAIVAYTLHKKKNIPFGETFFRLIGLHFWFKHIGAQILLSLVPSVVFTFLFLQVVSVAIWPRILLAYLLVLFSALPIIMGILYLISKKNEKIVTFVTYINTIWFGIILAFAIAFGFVATTT